MIQTQQQIIKAILDSGREISSIDAIKDFKITRLAAVVLQLRKQGMDIAAVRRNVRTRYGQTSVSFYFKQKAIKNAKSKPKNEAKGI
jgi:Helix-turn-helix domain